MVTSCLIKIILKFTWSVRGHLADINTNKNIDERYIYWTYKIQKCIIYTFGEKYIVVATIR